MNGADGSWGEGHWTQLASEQSMMTLESKLHFHLMHFFCEQYSSVPTVIILMVLAYSVSGRPMSDMFISQGCYPNDYSHQTGWLRSLLYIPFG
eukprot:scaffold64958_cov25-Prasinocladus_malaysianus.AAC.1